MNDVNVFLHGVLFFFFFFLIFLKNALTEKIPGNMLQITVLIFRLCKWLLNKLNGSNKLKRWNDRNIQHFCVIIHLFTNFRTKFEFLIQ